ncbi:MAG: RDD family protein [Nanoarchaeota archaeon]|nr:RDD family protein [Nanoarchaeota archaeon]
MRTNLNLPKEAVFKAPAVFWKRLLAFLIDILIVDFVIGYPFRRLIIRLIPMTDFSKSYSYLVSNPKAAATVSLITFVMGLLALLYFALLEYKTGQTLGKMLVNIRIESVAKELTFFACVMRSIFLIFIFPLVLLWIIDPLFLIFTRDKRRLSEVLSRTRTIEIRSLMR